MCARRLSAHLRRSPQMRLAHWRVFKMKFTPKFSGFGNRHFPVVIGRISAWSAGLSILHGAEIFAAVAGAGLGGWSAVLFF